MSETDIAIAVAGPAGEDDRRDAWTGRRLARGPRVDTCCRKKIVYGAGLASFSGDATHHFGPLRRHLIGTAGFDAEDFVEMSYAGWMQDGAWIPRPYHVTDVQGPISTAPSTAVARQLEWYRARLPETVFYLAGYSLGGVIAFEAAEKLLLAHLSRVERPAGRGCSAIIASARRRLRLASRYRPRDRCRARRLRQGRHGVTRSRQRRGDARSDRGGRGVPPRQRRSSADRLGPQRFGCRAHGRCAAVGPYGARGSRGRGRPAARRGPYRSSFWARAGAIRSQDARGGGPA